MVNHDTGATGAGANNRLLPVVGLSEPSQWRSLGFVDPAEVGVRSNWSPVVLSGADDRVYAQASRMGALYALDVVGHLRRFPDNPDRLVDLIGEIVAAGRWTAVEIGFVSALAEYLADARIWVTAADVVDLRRTV